MNRNNLIIIFNNMKDRILHLKKAACAFLVVLLLSMAGLAKVMAQGALPGVFSVSESTQVRFSQGNLQYIGSAASPYWKFADHQWDYLGDNGQGSNSQTVDRDLFGWGTSGYDHGAVCYQPWSTSTENCDYYAYGRYSYNLFDQTGQADWGYNAISNGGNQENSGWRTLTTAEWDYVFNTRETTSGIRYAKAVVNGMNGMILLPDNWMESVYVLNNANNRGSGYDSNTITAEDWTNVFEMNGAVFLPAAGYRYGTSVNDVGGDGRYCSSTCGNGTIAYNVYFCDYDFYTSYEEDRCDSQSVRLVCAVENSMHGYIDLGLPSGTLWATCNVGANAPEEYGDYFAWGETHPKDVYEWSTYQYCNGDYNTLTKYCNNADYGYNGFTDTLTVLLPEDDAATAIWGSGWRMPTQVEFEELYNNTTVTWTTQNGVNGRLFTASNGNSLFLPAAGYRYYGSLYNAGSYGNYWSSSLYIAYLAWSFGFRSDDYGMYNDDRNDGFTVRPVRSSSQNLTFGINATPNPAEGGGVSGGGAYPEGTDCTLIATASAGYTFINWTENGEVVSTVNPYTFTVTGDRELVANFEALGEDVEILIYEPFEEYTVDNMIAAEAIAAGHEWWTTWNNNPGSTEDGTVAYYGGNQCGHISGTNDNVFLLGDRKNGKYDLEFDILVPAGQSGYFNVLHNFNSEGSTWALQAYFHATHDGDNTYFNPGHGTVHAGSNNTCDLPCVYDEWMHLRVHVDTDNDLAYLYFNGQLMCQWQWSLDSFGNSGVGRTLAAMDFFAPLSNSEFYIDNLSFKKIGGDSAPVFSVTPNAVSEPLGENDMTTVDITLSNNGNSIGEWVGWLDFGQGGDGTQNAELTYHNGDASTSIGSNTAEYTREMAVRLPETFYAGTAMGMKITSVDYYIFPTYKSADDHYTFRIYGQGANNQPGELLAEQTVMSSEYGTWITATFDEEVYLTGQTIWATVELLQNANEYPMSMDGGNYGKESDGNWLRTNGGKYSHCYSEGNYGGAWLITVHCEGELIPATWASIDKSVGSVLGGQSDVIVLSLNTVGLEQGTYNANLIINTNDENMAHVEIPVTLHYDGSITTPTYVDLGLPSGTLWATFNVGANAPEEYGDYFAWGETQPKDDYSWATYQYGDGSTFTKYTGSDGLTTLLPEDDAATANWGSDWRMPTKEEYEELYNNTTVTYTTQNGVNGRLFTASNGNTLFLPAAGGRLDGLFNDGSWGYYWSSTLYSDYPDNAWYFYIYSDGYDMNLDYRFPGFSVRPVRSSQNLSFNINATPNPAEGGVIEGTGSYEQGADCTLTATATEGYTFINWTENGEVVSTENPYTFTVTGDRELVANFAFMAGSGELGHTYYDWQSNSGAITRTIVWPDGRVNFAFTTASDASFSDRGTGIGTYDSANNEWIPSSGRVENMKTGFGSIARYGSNGVVIAAHTSSDCRIFIAPDKDNIEPYSLSAAGVLDNTNDPAWPNVMTSGPDRDIIHVIAKGYSDDKMCYFRSTDGGQTWDKQNVILPYMGSEYCTYWESNSCYWMETTDDNCLALVVNNPWSDGMVIYSYDDGETWERKVFYKHPNPFGSFEEPFYYPRWTSCQWDNQHHLHVLYEFGAVSGQAGSSNAHTALGGVAYWDEDMPYNSSGITISAIDGNLAPGQPFVMDSAYMDNDIYRTWWHSSDPTHEMWPEYMGYLAPLTDDGYPEDPYQATGFNIEDLSKHGSYNNGVCGFPVLCMVPGSDEMVAVWSALDENHQDGYGNYYYKLFASYSNNGGASWSPMVHLTNSPELNYSEFVYNQAVVVGRKLIIATQTDEETGTYVQSDDVDGSNNYYRGFVFDIDELFNGMFQITALVNPEESGVIEGVGYYELGTECTLTATANEGYLFMNWTENGEVVSTENPYTFTVTGDRELVANFEEYHNPIIPTEGLIAYYPFNGNANDESGNGNHGTLQGNVPQLTTDRFGNENSAYLFGGYNNSGYISVPNSSSLQLNNALSMSFWMNLNGYDGMDGWGSHVDYGNFAMICKSGDNSGFNVMANRHSDDSLHVWSFNSNGCYNVYGDRNYQFGEWIHCVVTIEDAVSKLYLNGMLMQESIGSQADFSNANGQSMYIGIMYGYWYPFNGKLDDIILYNRALTPQEVQTLYGVNEGLIAYYSFDGDANDYSGNEYHATPYNSYQFENGIVGDCIAVEGQGDTGSSGGHVMLPELDFGGSTEFTLNLWVKSLGLTQPDGESCINFGVDDETDRLYIMRRHDRVSFAYHEAEISYYDENYLGNWIMYSLTCDENGALKAYVNGILVGEENVTFNGINTSLAALGRHWWSSGYENSTRFNGSFDDVRIYNRVLSAEELRMLYGQLVEIIATASPEEGGTVSGGGTIQFGQTCTLTATPNEGYAFMYWTENGQVVSNEAEYSFVVVVDRNLVANFSLPLNITAEASPEEYGTVSGVGEYDYGSECTLSAIPNENYSFMYWTEDGEQVSYDADYTFTVTSDRHLVANFCPMLNITASAIPEEGGTVTGAGEYDYNAECTLIATANDGYTFINWTENGEVVSTETDYSFVVVNDRNLVANFVEGESCVITFNLYDSYGDGWNGNRLVVNTDYGVTHEVTLNSGSSGTQTLMLVDGHHITLTWINGGWIYECSFTISYSNGNLIYTGADLSGTSFEFDMDCEGMPATTFDIAATANPEESGTITGAGEYVMGTECIVTAVANEGWTFVNWTENGNEVSTEASYTFTVTGNRNLIANFSLPLSITAEANPSEYGTVSGDGEYDYGSECTLSAIPNENYSFMYWTEDGEQVSYDADYTFIVTSDRHLVANFCPMLNITASAIPEEGGTVTGAGEYDYNAECTLTATANENWVFVNWTENGEVVSTEAEYSFTVTGDRDLVANFIRMLPSISDDFNDGVINEELWTATGTHVLEEDGLLKLQQNVTDNYTALESKPLSIPEDNQIVINRLFLLHEQLHSSSWGDHYFYGNVNIKLNGSNDNYIGIYYLDDDYENRHGTYLHVALNGEHSETRICDAAFDTWVKEKMVINLAEESFSYYLSDTLVATLDAPGVSTHLTRYYTVRFKPDGWWTGHYHNMNYVNINDETQFMATVNVSANPEAGGVVTGSGIYEEGQVCDLTATANEGYNFINWTKDGEEISTNTNYSFIVMGGGDYVANFELNSYDITATANLDAGGTVTGAGTYYQFETCTLTATANEGYTFINWTKDGEVITDDPTYSFTVTEEGDYVANFELNSYDITVTADPDAGGTVEGAGTYYHFETCILTASVNEGYHFINWTKDGEEVSTEQTYTFTVTGGGNYVANYELNSYDIAVTANPDGGGVITGAGTYYHFETCTVTATANDGFLFVNWTENGTEISTNAEYSFTVTSGRSFVANFISIQSTALAEGWTWYSTCIELSGLNGLEMIEQGLGDNGILIKSHVDGFVTYDEGMWMGSLNAINNESMYLFNTSAPCVLNLTGTFAVPSQHPITLYPGWNWIGYPSHSSADVNVALSNLTPGENDLVKTQFGFATYDESMGWAGTFNTIDAGSGMMYYSSNSQTVSFVYNEDAKGGELLENITADGNHYVPKASAYPYNMNMIAVVELDGVEARSGELELSAFAGNECRGSVRMLYVEALDRYTAFLTVHGNEAATLTMRLVDTETGMEYVSEQNFEFETNAILGSLREPVVLRFNNATTQCDSYLSRMELYPNPVEAGASFKLNTPDRLEGEVRVEVINALGAVLSTEKANSFPASVKAPKVPGVYTVRVTMDNHGSYSCKLIVK